MASLQEASSWPAPRARIKAHGDHGILPQSKLPVAGDAATSHHLAVEDGSSCLAPAVQMQELLAAHSSRHLFPVLAAPQSLFCSVHSLLKIPLSQSPGKVARPLFSRYLSVAEVSAVSHYSALLDHHKLLFNKMLFCMCKFAQRPLQ